MWGYFGIGFIDFLSPAKKLTDYTKLFCRHDFKKNVNIILSLFTSKRNKSNSIKYNLLERIDKTVLCEQRKFRLRKIIGIENYFYQEINQGKSCNTN